MAKVAVQQDENKLVPVEILAASIVSISDGIKRLRAGPLTEKALLLLIQNAASAPRGGRPLSQKDIKAVLDGIEAMKDAYVKRKLTIK